MFPALCQGRHSLREPGKELIRAEKELLHPPGMAAKSGWPRARAKPSALAHVRGSLVWEGRQDTGGPG